MKEEPRWRRYGRLYGADPHSDTEAELRFHLEMRVRDYMRRGMSEAEARAAAMARLGDIEAVRRECADEDEVTARQRRRVEWLGELRQDLRYGMRMLVRAPAFAFMAVLTLAIGIGATTAIFSLVHAVLLEPLGYADPDRLVRVWETSPQGDRRNVVSPGNAADWVERARSFRALGAYRQPYGVALTGEGESMRIIVADVQPVVMRALEVAPLLGRTLLGADAAGAGDVVVLSHALWQQRYGGDRAVLGRRLILNHVPFTVVGVMPRGFAFPDEAVELWRPLREAELDRTQRRSHTLYVLGRLAPNVTVAQAQAEMTAIAARITGEHPQHMTGWGVNVVPLHADLTAQVSPLFRVLLAGVAVVLLIACGNLANLLLARAVAREREIALRGALGAGRARIARQLFTESVLLATLGGVGALLISPLLLKALVGAAPPDIPLLERAAIDLRMLGFTAAVAFGCALLFGFAPAIRLLHTDVQSVLRAGRAGGVRSGLREALLVAQVALSVVLLIGAGLFVRSFAALQATELGFDAANIVTMEVDLPHRRYASSADHIAFYERVIERVRAVPNVVSVAGTNEPPGGQHTMTFSFGIDGRPAQSASGREDPEHLRAVTPEYFDLLRQRVVEGRAFDARDRADGVPVAIIDESLARKHWPDRSPLGARIAFQPGETPWLEIVGVVAEVRWASPAVAPVPALYIPHAQKTWPWLSWLTVLARVAPRTDETALKTALRDALLELDPALPPQSLGTVAESFRENLARRSFALALVSGFGALALLLSVVGLYGLLAYMVAQQKRDIGVRLAIGAHAATIVRSIVARSLAVTFAGAAGGLLIATSATRVLETLLYGVSRLDAATYAGTALLVLAVALATAAGPAWQAARVSPLQALRSD